MSIATTNYALVKPELTDAADITAMNENWDKLDSTLKKKADLGDDGKIPSSQLSVDLSAKVSKTGDTLTGVLVFRNTDGYGAIEKYRTINGVERHIDVGVGNVGGDGCVALQYMEGSGNTVLGRLEIGRRGVSFYDENGNRTFLYRNGAVSASVES